uniref:Uncharacterized protein LOC105121886 isoform X2 n=1 Tax=Rhizophora mucronata TaxID=61149 RepID=A0A2P2MLL4_RHIMU
MLHDILLILCQQMEYHTFPTVPGFHHLHQIGHG